MKTNIIKLFMLPIAAFTLASAAAVTTDTSRESKATTSMIAYIHNPLISSCKQVEVDCETGEGLECVSGAWEAFGGTPVVCADKLHRVE